MGIDIIIPAYNSKDTLLNTLTSIVMQKDLEKINIQVTIVNDCSDYSYSSLVDYFSPYLNIQELVTDKNVGPGEARNLGIKSTKNEYIIFIDSDDCFYGTNSIKTLYDQINSNNYDLIISDFICNRNGIKEIKKHDFIWLHGKIYRRSFLEKNTIYFNKSRANEDNGFNQLVLLMKPNISFISTITYIYQDNSNSITQKNNRLYELTGLEGFAYNINWAIEEGLKRNCDKNDIVLLAMKSLISMYYNYIELYDKYDVSPIIKWSKPILDTYNKFPDLAITQDEINIFIKLKEQSYLKHNIKLNKKITFTEFLSKINELK